MSSDWQLDDPLLAIAIRNGISRDLVLAAESGMVRVLDLDGLKIKQEWSAHENAIFDLKWRPSHDHCLTASGDTSFSLWDMECVRSQRRTSLAPDLTPILSQKSAHLSTIKSVSFMDENVLASASRDGFIHLWDVRCNTSLQTHTIAGGHIAPGSASGSGSKRLHNSGNKKKGKEGATRSNPIAAVTAVLFQPYTNRLFSAGASDASIKLWDVRMLKNTSGNKKGKGRVPGQQSCVRVMHTGDGNSRHGFSSLAFDPRFNVYASCSDHKIYSFDPASGDILSTYSGNMYRTDIFTKISILDNYLVSGSVAGSAPVWSIPDSRRIDPSYNMDVKPRVILPHDEEVTVVDVDHQSMSIFSLSDDVRINKWSLYEKLDGRIDPASRTHSQGQAVRYVEKEMEIEEMLPRQRMTAKRCRSWMTMINTPSPANTSPASAQMTTPSGSLPVRSSPLTTIKDWLTVNSNSSSPNNLALGSQACNNEVTGSQQSSKKRTHNVSKENSQEAGNRGPSPGQAVPSDQMSSLTLTPGHKAKKLRRGQEIPSRKISDYFHA